MDKKLNSLFSNLSEEEMILLANKNYDLSTGIDSETKNKIAKMINQKTNLNLEAEEKSDIRKFKAKPFKVALIAAIVTVLLAVSASAAYTFIMPEGFFKNQDYIVFDSVYTVVDTDKAGKGEFKTVNKTVKSNEYTITFEAIAKGKMIRNVSREWDDIASDKTYAIFTVKADDGQQILMNKIDYSEIGFNIAVKGYDPSSCFIPMLGGRYCYEENGVLFYVCDITDAELFADKELHISVFEISFPDGTVLRMDENGDPYFVESFDGFKAMFDLNLDDSLADSKKAEEYAKEHYFNTNPDYSWADGVIAKDEAFKESGIDLSMYIGDNEWRGSYDLQFGEVKMANEFIELQKNRTEEMNIFTCSELHDIFMNNFTYEFIAGLEDVDFENPDVQIPIPAEWLATDGYTEKLSDGSEVKYLGDQFYIHYENSGDIKLIMVPCHNMVFQFDMTFNSVNNIINMFPDRNRPGISGTYAIGLYIDKEITRPNLKRYLATSDQSADEFVKMLYPDFESEEDAIFEMAIEFAYHSGIVQVVK